MWKRILVLVLFLFGVFWWLSNRSEDPNQTSNSDTVVEESVETEESEESDEEDTEDEDSEENTEESTTCLLYTSPSPRDLSTSRMPSSA